MSVLKTADTDRDAGHGSEDESGSGLSVAELGAQICVIAGRLAADTCRWLELVAEFDRRKGWSGAGINSCAHWVAWACSMAPGAAREHVRVARALTEMPLIREAFASGELSYSKVRELTRVAGRVDEEYLVRLARTATASQLARSVRGFRRSDPDRLVQETRRSLRWHTDDDGSLRLSAVFPAEEGAAVVAALEMALQRLREERTAATPLEEAPHPVDIPAADALLLVAQQFCASGPRDVSGADRTTVVVHVDAETLAAAVAGEPSLSEEFPETSAPPRACRVDGVGVTPGTAARLSCEAKVIAMVHGLDGEVLHHGRARRLVSAAQRRALMVRDGCCQFPSCQRHTNLEAHHVVPWAKGGPTDLENLILLCRFHHVAVHERIADIVEGQGADADPGPVRWEFAGRTVLFCPGLDC